MHSLHTYIIKNKPNILTNMKSFYIKKDNKKGNCITTRHLTTICR
jgi:hypothetical protein